MIQTGNRQQTQQVIDRLRRARPTSRRYLAAYVKAFLGLRIPDQRMCPGHDSPMDYLAWAILGEDLTPRHKVTKRNTCGTDKLALSVGNTHGTGIMDKGTCPCHPDTNHIMEEKGVRTLFGDCVVWANRGGGKTQLGAAASLLECVFWPGMAVRILGGSEQQSQQMVGYLRQLFENGFDRELAGTPTSRMCRFVNGSDVQALTQSDRSVRGQHVQRLRCDEVELFDREVWQAAQFVTQSTAEIPARLEVFSTMHRPYGLMHEIVQNANANHMRVFRWCLWEVIERCVDRSCSRCPLWSDCRGRAKQANGYYAIDDAIAQKRRSSMAAWQSEMLCQRPSRDDVVFAEFDPNTHVGQADYNPDWPLYRTIDFGYSNPLVCLFVQVDGEDRVRVIDEHIKSRTTLAEHARLIKERYPYSVEASFCDPAGRQRHEITGTNAVTEMAALGIPLKCRQSSILDGVELIRRFLSPADGPTKLIVSPQCENLIRALQGLHYQRLGNGALSELPDKDGVHDHLIDALRYFFVNRFAKAYTIQETRY